MSAAPLPDGVYLYLDDAGEPQPMRVHHGEQLKLASYFEERANGVHTLALVDDPTPTVIGPLVWPHGRA